MCINWGIYPCVGGDNEIETVVFCMLLMLVCSTICWDNDMGHEIRYSGVV